MSARYRLLVAIEGCATQQHPTDTLADAVKMYKRFNVPTLQYRILQVVNHEGRRVYPRCCTTPTS